MYPEKPIRYDKNSLIYINGKEYTLIAFLSEKRKEKKITKKTISTIIKGNDNWYSQIEMGKIDNNRKRFIKRPDLIDIISVVIYGAKNPLDLERYATEAENYIDVIMNVTPFDQYPRQIPVYELLKQAEKISTSEYTDNRINEYLEVLNSTIKDFYKKCNIIEQNSIINFLSALILNMQKEPIMTLHYCSLPFFAIFSAQGKDETSQEILEKDFLTDLDDIMKKYNKLLYEGDSKFIIQNLLKSFECANKYYDHILTLHHVSSTENNEKQ